jgi:hypothetical protein
MHHNNVCCAAQNCNTSIIFCFSIVIGFKIYILVFIL